jgi:hypothetical protein
VLIVPDVALNLLTLFQVSQGTANAPLVQARHFSQPFLTWKAVFAARISEVTECNQDKLRRRS